MDVETYLAKKAELEEALRDNAKGMVKTFFEKFFDDFPTIHEVLWAQYTPYFNDGEACVFGVHYPYFRLAGYERVKNAWEADDAEGHFYPYSKRVPNGLTEKEAADLKKWVSVFKGMETIFEQLGDHSFVSVQRDGTVEVTECDHE